MKKIVISLFLAAGLILLSTPANWADTEDFAITANIPPASGVTITAAKYASSDDAFLGFVDAFNFNLPKKDLRDSLTFSTLS